MNPLLLPWAAELGLITWRDVKGVKGKSRLPFPSEFLASFIVFGAFSLIPNSRIGAVLGWGIVIATFLNVFDPSNPQLVVVGAPIEQGQGLTTYRPPGGGHKEQ